MTEIRKDAFFFCFGVDEGHAWEILFKNELLGSPGLACPEYCFFIFYFWHWRSLPCILLERPVDDSGKQKIAPLRGIFVINSVQFKNSLFRLVSPSVTLSWPLNN
jgi:hypothetical protein